MGCPDSLLSCCQGKLTIKARSEALNSIGVANFSFSKTSLIYVIPSIFIKLFSAISTTPKGVFNWILPLTLVTVKLAISANDSKGTKIVFPSRRISRPPTSRRLIITPTKKVPPTDLIF